MQKVSANRMESISRHSFCPEFIFSAAQKIMQTAYFLTPQITLNWATPQNNLSNFKTRK